MRIFLMGVVAGLLLQGVMVAQSAAPGSATESAKVALPAPSRSGGMTLTEALATRRSVRSFAATKLTSQEIGQLLWAAQGITDKKGHRTAPSAHAHYYLHVYVATADGFFEYLPAGHELLLRSATDLRAFLSDQGTVKHAPAVLLITGEYDRAGKGAGERFVHLEAGHAAQNVLLQATALGLGAVPVGGVDPKQVQQATALSGNQTAIYLIPVGHTK